MPTGRHARVTGALAQSTTVAPDGDTGGLIVAAVNVLDDVPTVAVPPPSSVETPDVVSGGRRRRAAPSDEASAVLLASTAADTGNPPPLHGRGSGATGFPGPAPITPGSGRRRKPPADESTAPTAVAPTGRRRKPSEPQPPTALPRFQAPIRSEPPTRATAPVQPAAVQPIATAQPVAVRQVATAQPVVDEIATAEPDLADVVRLSAAHGRRRNPSRLRIPTSGTPAALVAGAAAVAIAAVGAITTASGGVQFGAASTDLAANSALAQSNVPLDAAASLAGAERASRDRARAALAQRIAHAAAAKAKQDALGKALRMARQRAARLARLAKFFILPVRGYHLTAGFGEGGGLWYHGHTGQDFACPAGTPIHAIANGTIIGSGWDGPYGWKTVERLADGTEIWYAHQSKIIVRSGPVFAGQVIGLIGSTGNATGPHLHLEVRPHGEDPVDPMPWLREHGMHP